MAKDQDSPISSERLDKIVRPKGVWLSRVFFGVVGLFVLFLIYYGVRTTASLAKIVVKNSGRGSPLLSGKIGGHKLQGEGDGRINVLLLGIGGAGHPGGLLTDTIMVLSLDPVNHKAAFITIPRDLAVTYPKPLTGAGKINNVHAYGEEQKKSIPGGGPALMKEAISTVLDLPIHYFVRIDFKAFEKLVEAVGGVTVNVDKPIYDPLYPAENMVDYAPFSMSAGMQNLDGKTALKYVRSRETTSDFDRSRRQIQVLQALKEKFVRFDVIGNPVKINQIAGILGDHVRTDMSLSEMQHFFDIAIKVDQKPIAKVFDTGEGSPLTSTTGEEGAYLVVPKSGNFKQVQRIAHEIFTDPYLALERANVEVRNASGLEATAAEVESLLKSYGYQVVKVASSKDVSAKTVIYDFSQGNKTHTVDFLKNRLKGEVVSQPDKTIKRSSSADILVVLGNDYEARKTTIKLSS